MDLVIERKRVNTAFCVRQTFCTDFNKISNRRSVDVRTLSYIILCIWNHADLPIMCMVTLDNIESI